MIVFFSIDGQPGGIHAGDISMVLTDTYNTTRSVVYTGTHPGGITVDQSPADMLVAWSNAITEVPDD